eukprot:3607643-Amphidinium_carterae.1
MLVPSRPRFLSSSNENGPFHLLRGQQSRKEEYARSCAHGTTLDVSCNAIGGATRTPLHIPIVLQNGNRNGSRSVTFQRPGTTRTCDSAQRGSPCSQVESTGAARTARPGLDDFHALTH